MNGAGLRALRSGQRRSSSFGRGWFITALVAATVCVISCRKTPPVQPIPGADALQTQFGALAREFVSQAPEGSRIVVANFTRLGSASNSLLGAYLAERLTSTLQRDGKNRITLIDRPAGERATAEELEFSAGPTDYKSLLTHFRADCAVFATYDLRADDCLLELIEVKAVSTSGAELSFAGRCLVKSGGSDFAYWQKLEHQLLPNMSPHLARFFTESGSWTAVEKPQIITGDGSVLAANGSVAVGDLCRVKVRLNEPCFISLLGWDQTNGIMTVLYPAPKDPPGFSAGEQLLPAIRADPPAGYNLFKVIATRRDIGLRTTGESFLTDPATQAALVDTILSLGANNWGAVSAGYSIVEK